VLLKQDKTEAVMSVSARLDFINKEMCVDAVLGRLRVCMLTGFISSRIEKQIQGIQEKSEKVKMEVRLHLFSQRSAWHANNWQIMQIQSAAQQAQEAAA
jgi:prefoldin beta subunit